MTDQSTGSAAWDAYLRHQPVHRIPTNLPPCCRNHDSAHVHGCIRPRQPDGSRHPDMCRTATAIDLLDHLDDDPVSPEVKDAAERVIDEVEDWTVNTPQTWAAAWILASPRDDLRAELFGGLVRERYGLDWTAERGAVTR